MSQPNFTALITIRENCGYVLPDRNFRTFGRDYNPLYRRMIGKLEAIERVEHIVINTDSERVKQAYARDRNFTVIHALPKREQEMEPLDMEMSPDSITASMLEKVSGEHFLQLGSIFPFLRERTIESAIDTYDRYILDPENSRHDSLFSITAIDRRMYDSDNDVLRQDRPNTFVEDGILHIFNRATFLASGKSKAGKSPFGFSIDHIENMAIDSEENCLLAEFVMENQHRFPRVFR